MQRSCGSRNIVTVEGRKSPANTTGGYIIMKRGKRYLEAAKAIDSTALYDKEEAVALAKKAAVANFD